MKISHLPNTSGIYTITNEINSKMYIGYGKRIRKRAKEHKWTLCANLHDNNKLQKSWNKYGKESFTIDVLVECEEQYLASEENYWCNLLNAHNDKYGYNIKPTSPHGNSGISESTRAKLREWWSNNPHPLKGTTKTPEEKKILSDIRIEYYKCNIHVLTGISPSQETRDKISKASKGRKDSIEGRRNKSIGHIGEKRNPDEVKRRVLVYKENRKRKRIALGKPNRLSRVVKVYKCDDYGNIIQIYKSCKEAALDNNCDTSTIAYACRGKIKKVKGYKWKREIIEMYEE